MSVVCPTRRNVLFGLGGLAAFSLAPKKVKASQSTIKRDLRFYNIHTQERQSGDFWVDGIYQPTVLTNFSQVLRDHRQNRSAPMDKNLYQLLFQLRNELNIDDEFHVISGYRSPKTNKMLANKSHGVAKKSYHMKGMAIDIALPETKLSHMRDAAISLNLGGVGYYPKSGFIHVDTGPVRTW